MSIIRDEKLDFWVKNDLNVLFSGKHGVGKSSIIIDTFKRHKLNWLYFSAATMDPWVDFIGVPREELGDNGERFLDLIRPKIFQEDTVEALFFDELNCAHKKVRNAVMELIQFRSINGKPFNNLKIIWAAINPEDDEDQSYDVEALDPAQKDRFHVHVELPYRPDRSYFTSKFGVEVATPALEWWRQLPKDIVNDVSPRRLDYALDVHSKGGDIRDTLPGRGR